MFAILTTRVRPIFSQLPTLTAVNPCLSPARVSSSFFLPTQKAVTQLRHYAPVPPVPTLSTQLQDTDSVRNARARLLQRQLDLKTIREGCQILLRRIEDDPHPNSHEGPTQQYIALKERIQEIDEELMRVNSDIETMKDASGIDGQRLTSKPAYGPYLFGSASLDNAPWSW